MASTDIEPWLLDAIKLLYSKNEDSEIILKHMLDEQISLLRRRDDDDKPKDIKSGASILKNAILKRENTASDLAKKESLIDYGKRDFSDIIKKEPSYEGIKIKTDHDKKYPEKNKLTSMNIFEAMEIKKPKLEKERSRSNTPEPIKYDKKKDVYKDSEKVREKNRYKEKAEESSIDHDKDKERYKEKEKIKKIEEVKKEKEYQKIISSDSESDPEIPTEISDESMDTDDFAATMGLTCTVCKQFDVTAGNQLVECQECHNLYHQECHRPEVVTSDINDPRFVWYCVRCTKNMKKMVTTKPNKPKTHSTPPAIPIKESSVPFTKPVKQEINSQPFKRVETVKPSSTLSSKQMGGLAGLAANLSGKSLLEAAAKHLPSHLKPDPAVKPIAVVSSSGKSSTKSSSTSSSSSKTFSSGLSSDKKIQLMKKKSSSKLEKKAL